MKRVLFLFSVALLFAVVAVDDAYAICQKCNNNNTATAMCYTIVDPCEYNQATMGACVEKDGENGTKYCDGVNSPPGPECSQPQPGCSGGPGSSDCTISFGASCPPACFSCTYDWGGGGGWEWWWWYLY